MSESVNLHFKLAEEEWVAASRLYMLRQPGIILRFVTAFILLVLGLVFFTAINEAVLSLFLLSVGVVLFSFVAALLFVLPRQRFRNDRRHLDEFFLEFTEDGIGFRTERIESRLDWSLYNSAMENEKLYVLVYGKGMITVIPKRAFNAHGQETVFRRLLGRKLGPINSGSGQLKEKAAEELQDAYVPPAEPPDWR
ncbi:MAG TPA: YcxB family protein [Pyrinomonadaceae bacterium]|jgi:hypothetical protein|nr:YcxB family protein [Pyrinomonadaceae bacterium]